jgi:hypothetical protein
VDILGCDSNHICGYGARAVLNDALTCAVVIGSAFGDPDGGGLFLALTQAGDSKAAPVRSRCVRMVCMLITWRKERDRHVLLNSRRNVVAMRTTPLASLHRPRG